MGWLKDSCFNPDSGFILHTKDWVREVPKGSDQCAAAVNGPLTTKGGEHLFGSWGACSLASAACHAQLPFQSSPQATEPKQATNRTKLKKGRGPTPHSHHQTGLTQYLTDGKVKKRHHHNESLPQPPYPMPLPSPIPDEVTVKSSSVLRNVTYAACSLKPLSHVTKLTSSDRYGVLAIPKTATTSLTQLMQKAGLSASCGGVLWQNSKPSSCPPKQQTSIVLRPSNWNPQERNGRPKSLSHVLHPNFDEIKTAWSAHSDGKGKLKMVVVIRDPVSRLFSAYIHGKQFHMKNQISPADKAVDRKKQSLKERMNMWRSFYWSYRDYNDSTLLLTNDAKDFSEFAAIPYLPTHNQQTRMIAGVQASVIVDSNVLNLAKQNLCHIECVGVLDALESLVECVSRQLGLKHQALPEKNLKGANSHDEITGSARDAARKNGWADLMLHSHATDIIKNRVLK